MAAPENDVRAARASRGEEEGAGQMQEERRQGADADGLVAEPGLGDGHGEDGPERADARPAPAADGRG
ncbi:hypothetical protein [Streptomyces sp. KMM 9044]|uniref:hypothetical protein n=1 Tax=Streptomyces sp. KMM 9044 TaxID=2744474 RepID=UPI0022B22085|nr:hypothetical protein [Streptomyces sp. KMM 9044]WAX77984.1 hypothetical protein HUV60_010155 [Streptomyces sp. KMM 9044]